MPPKKPAADSVEPPVASSSDAPAQEKVESKADAAALRKLSSHPSTIIMITEAVSALDSRKGVSSQAIQNYIKQKYPSVDLVRLKHLVRKSLIKGLENGTLVRPANATVTTGATGKFRLAPKVKEPKPKTENVDPNVRKAPKPAKEGAKKPKASATKKKGGANEQETLQEESTSPKKSKPDEEATVSKAAPAKKTKAKKAVEKGDSKPASASAKAKEAKAGKASQGKAAKEESDAPATKATGKRGKKTAE